MSKSTTLRGILAGLLAGPQVPTTSPATSLITLCAPEENAPLEDKLRTVTGLATSLLYANKPPETVEIQAKQLQNSISAEPKQEHVRLLEQDEHYPSTLKPLPHYEYCSSIEKDHFVLLSLTSPDSKK